MTDNRWTLLPIDCRDAMRLCIAPESVDSIVTDPPYHLTSIVKRFGAPDAASAQYGTDGAYSRASAGFMGKQWDGGDIAQDVGMWRLAWERLKPGGWLVAFGGTRTYHRMVCAIEDAGFEIRDQIGWAYGQGFPKSHDVSKGIDKMLGAEREIIGVNPNARQSGADRANGWDRPWQKDPEAAAKMLSRAATPEAQRWDGWGTALKPAWEPICLARKPLVGTVAQNVLAHGTGALNIDACRVAGTGVLRSTGNGKRQRSDGYGMNGGVIGGSEIGRWPANLIHDGSNEVLEAFPTAPGQIARASINAEARKTQNVYGTMRRGSRPGGFGNVGAAKGDPLPNGPMYGDSGSAARFFYCAKASNADREEGNGHPTVKPTPLMRYLCRLVTPPGGLVLDPFAGSGSTGKAALLEGFRFVGCEMTEEYIPIAEARLNHAEKECSR